MSHYNTLRQQWEEDEWQCWNRNRQGWNCRKKGKGIKYSKQHKGGRKPAGNNNYCYFNTNVNEYSNGNNFPAVENRPPPRPAAPAATRKVPLMVQVSFWRRYTFRTYEYYVGLLASRRAYVLPTYLHRHS